MTWSGGCAHPFADCAAGASVGGVSHSACWDGMADRGEVNARVVAQPSSKWRGGKKDE